MKRTTKMALITGSALTIALAGAAVYAHPEGGWGPGFGYGMGPGHHMGYGMGPGGHMGYGTGPGGYMGWDMGPRGHMGYGVGPGGGMGYGYGPGLAGLLHGFPDSVGERLDTLKSTLGITESQQPAWQSFADSVTKQAENRLAWFDKMHGSEVPPTTPERFAQRNEAMKQHQNDREAVASALQKLYAALTPEQRSVIDGAPGGRRGSRYGWR